MTDMLDLHPDKISPEPNSGCWIWVGNTVNGRYGWVRYEGSNKTAHRVSWCVKNGVIPKNKMILHHCDNKLCVNPDHLYVGTHRDNMNDKVARNKQFKGETVPTAKLTDNEARQIKNDKNTSGVELARKYGVSPATISEIRLSRHWKHI